MEGYQDDLVSKGTCHQAWRVEFHPWGLRYGRRNPPPTRCPLTSICVIPHREARRVLSTPHGSGELGSDYSTALILLFSLALLCLR